MASNAHSMDSVPESINAVDEPARMAEMLGTKAEQAGE